ncbi:MAG: NAD kinase [Bacteroidia bacterium]|nr:NAD kinase [Bacteroidia bacterium]
MKIGVYAKSVRDSKHEQGFTTLIHTLVSMGHEIYCTESLVDFIHIHIANDIPLKTFTYLSKEEPVLDVMLCVGGDGTLLDTMPLVRNSGVPVLGLNTGRLGFLAGMNVAGIEKALIDIQKGNYAIDNRTLLQLETTEQIFEYGFALNDFVIHKKETSSMIVVHTYLNGEFLNSYWSDGLIISTPTGSTGYSLSCGGPIIFPNSGTFVITPIAPHNLNVRPVVVSDDVVLSFEIEGRASSYLTSLDARSKSITNETQMAVRKAEHTFNLIRLTDDNFLDTLRNKLNWGFDRRN